MDQYLQEIKFSSETQNRAVFLQSQGDIDSQLACLLMEIQISFGDSEIIGLKNYKILDMDSTMVIVGNNNVFLENIEYPHRIFYNYVEKKIIYIYFLKNIAVRNVQTLKRAMRNTMPLQVGVSFIMFKTGEKYYMSSLQRLNLDNSYIDNKPGFPVSEILEYCNFTEEKLKKQCDRVPNHIAFGTVYNLAQGRYTEKCHENPFMTLGEKFPTQGISIHGFFKENKEKRNVILEDCFMKTPKINSKECFCIGANTFFQRYKRTHVKYVIDSNLMSQCYAQFAYVIAKADEEVLKNFEDEQLKTGVFGEIRKRVEELSPNKPEIIAFNVYLEQIS